MICVSGHAAFFLLFFGHWCVAERHSLLEGWFIRNTAACNQFTMWSISADLCFTHYVYNEHRIHINGSIHIHMPILRWQTSRAGLMGSLNPNSAVLSLAEGICLPPRHLNKLSH